MSRFSRCPLCRILGHIAVLGSIATVHGRAAQAAQRSDGQLTIQIVDRETGQPIAARMHLESTRGRAISLRLPGTAEFGDHFYIDGRLSIPLRVGQYTFELDAGPEYRLQSGHFEIERHAEDTKRVEMSRFANLREEGWFGGDLDVARRLADMPLAMRAEGLSVVPVHVGDSRRKAPRRRVGSADDPSQPAVRNDLVAGPFARLTSTFGGELLLFNMSPGTVTGRDNREQKTWQTVLDEAGSADAKSQLVARTPYAWDLPMWLASGRLDAIQLIHHHSLRDGVVDNEDDGRPRDRTMFPGRQGNGRWSEGVYYHALNCGLRIPPVAGSGSGTNENPVGTNRVYAYCDDDFSHERWWEAVEAGRVVVTNGPLLRPKVEGHPPGYVFHLIGSDSISLEVGLDLATRQPVEYLQIIKNGDVEVEVRLADWAKRNGRLPKITFDASGWFLVRAVTSNQRTYQFASSGPYYVEKSGGPRVSRRSVQFFLDWIEAARARTKSLPNVDGTTRQALLADSESARQFFVRLLADANAE